MCLNSNELLLFKVAAKKSVKEIYGFQQESKCVTFISNFFKETQQNQYLFQLPQLATFLNYYCEIILIYHKLQDMVNYNDTQFGNIAAIIAKVTDD
jgi:hypothetical protein